MRIGYARLSEEDQTLPLQRQALQAAGCGQVYEKREEGQEPMRAIAARFGVAPSTLYRNLAELP